MQLVQGKMLETLAGEGLAPIENPVGKCFDPQVHAAICQQPSAQHPEHTVLEEARKGYQLHGRTIRPADVVVSRKPDEQAPPPSEQDG